MSRFLSLVLRHKPEAAGITLDANGWVEVDTLIRGVNATGRNLTLEMLQKIVAEDDKGRFMFSEDDLKIRACQGHSQKVDLELKPTTPPEILYHGTAERFAAQIRKEGLKPQKRQYVHLSADVPTARKVGVRHGKPTIFVVAAKRMHEDGLTFYLSHNNVWLTDSVPAKYLKANE